MHHSLGSGRSSAASAADRAQHPRQVARRRRQGLHQHATSAHLGGGGRRGGSLPSLAAALRPRVLGGGRALGQRAQRLQVWERVAGVREVDRAHKLGLEIWVDRRLDILDAPRQQRGVAAARAAQQRDPRAVAGGIAHGVDLLWRAVGVQAQDHRAQRVDIAAERAGQHDLVHLRHAAALHQQLAAGVERGLGQLDIAHIVLRHHDLAARWRSARRSPGCTRPWCRSSAV